MNLKKIELFGFKSFADKTELDFESGVTAIVGPNGVGKSNIAESIRWVLGEQSAKELRGDKMEDVIFNGTETRSPLNFAEVSLTFSNKEKIFPIEYDEVTIARRIFRAGESQYLLNKTVVRLKDINDLLMGSGIGLDSYSIIGQGKIDLILSSKPEDRRYIFEEAAGITKYKSQKKEAFRKLEYTENNLLRINDIVKEVSRQISSIERQVKKAGVYKQRFEELKEKEIKAVFYSVGNLKNTLNSHLEENGQLKEKEELLTEEIEKMGFILREAKQKLSEAEEQLNQLYSKKVNIDARLENANRHIFLNTERINEIIERKENLERQIQTTGIKLQELKEQISKSRQELAVLTQDKAGRSQEINHKEQCLGGLDSQIGEAEKNIRESKEKIFATAVSESRNKNELAKISADIANIKARLVRLKTDKEKKARELREAEERFLNFGKDREAKDKKVEFLRKQKEQAVYDVDYRNKTVEEIKEQLNQLNQNLAACRSKLDYLKDLKAKFEGYQHGVKSVLMAKEQNQMPQEDIIGSVANLIEVEAGYEKAVEAALGENIQIVIVRDYPALKKCIDYLKNNNLGDATFICSDSIKRSGEANADFGNLGFKRLLDAVKYNSEFSEIIAFLFKNVYVAENLETALTMRDSVNNTNLKLVTKNGDVVRENLITCRTHQLEESSLIGREAKIRTLEDELNKYEHKAGALREGRQREDGELKNSQNGLQKLEISLQEEEISSANLSSALKSSETEKKKIGEEIFLLNVEISEAEKEENAMAGRKEDIEVQLTVIVKSSFEIKTAMTNFENHIESKKEEREELLVNVTQLKTELFSLTDLEINQNQTIKMLEDNHKEQSSLLDAQKQEIEDSKTRLGKLHLETEKVKQNIEISQEELKLTSNELESALQMKGSQIENIKEVENFIADKQKELQNIRQKLHETEVKGAELNYQIQNLKERMLENYKVNIEESEIIIEENFNSAATKREVEELKQKLSSIGAVNLIAIEEDKELRERFDFLNKQRQDLEEGKESLHKAITKINRTTKDLFIETFTNIRQAFKEFYQMLFGGGEAELSLLDEGDVLESGIEITIRPPGKKLQNISLLSGGEKALTAIALLFAVFKVKPSPFCILDEIDAPLDESNVDRFTKVLRDFIKTSQFIMITHNKKTIGMADIMYGVTMQEAGVSKIVSVKFKSSGEIIEPNEEAAVNPEKIVL